MRGKKYFSIALLLLVFAMNTLVQKQGNVWCFGGGYGLDFNPPNDPMLLTNGGIIPYSLLILRLTPLSAALRQ